MRCSSVLGLILISFLGEFTSYLTSLGIFSLFIGYTRFYGTYLFGFLVYFLFYTCTKITVTFLQTSGSVKKNGFLPVCCRKTYAWKNKKLLICTLLYILSIMLSIFLFFPWFLSTYMRDNDYLSLNMRIRFKCSIIERFPFNQNITFAMLSFDLTQTADLRTTGVACLTNKDPFLENAVDFYDIGVNLFGSQTVLLENSGKNLQILLPPFWSCAPAEDNFVGDYMDFCYTVSYSGEKTKTSIQVFSLQSAEDEYSFYHFSDGSGSIWSDGILMNGKEEGVEVRMDEESGYPVISSNLSLADYSFMSAPSKGYAESPDLFYPETRRFQIMLVFFPIAFHWMIQIFSFFVTGIIAEYLKILVTKEPKKDQMTLRFRTSRFRATAIISVSVLWLIGCLLMGSHYYFVHFIFVGLPVFIYSFLMLSQQQKMRLKGINCYFRTLIYLQESTKSNLKENGSQCSIRSFCTCFLTVFLMFFFIFFILIYSVYKLFFHVAILKSYTAKIEKNETEEILEEAGRNRKFFYALLFEVLFGAIPTFFIDLLLVILHPTAVFPLAHLLLSFLLVALLYPLLLTLKYCPMTLRWSVAAMRSLVLFPKSMVKESVETMELALSHQDKPKVQMGGVGARSARKEKKDTDEQQLNPYHKEDPEMGNKKESLKEDTGSLKSRNLYLENDEEDPDSSNVNLNAVDIKVENA